nr:hypothetical protein [Tanacetum cinerariifolium]
MMLERFSQNTVDLLALMSNVSNPQCYSPSSSTQVPQPLADNPHLDSSLSPAVNLIENLTNTLALFLPQTNNQLRTSSNARNQATVQDGRVVVQNVQGRQNRGQGMNLQGRSAAGYGGAQNKVRNVNPGQARLGQARPGQARPVKCYNCNGTGHIARNCGHDNAFDDDVDEQPDSNILSEVQDHDHYQDVVCVHHEEHVMDDSVQLDHVVDSHADYMSDSNMILYDQYVKENEVPVVHSDVSSVPNDAFMMIYNDMCKPHPQSVSNPSRNTVVKKFLTAELATYKEQVELYERWAKFELTEREQKINEQLRLVKDRLIKQDQSLQTVHSRPKPHYNELNRVAIGYKNPLCLTRAKQVQHALYNGYEIIKDNHALAIVHNTEDTLEIAEITRKKMNAKMSDPECVTRKKQLTPEQIFWSNDLIKLKSEALKEQTKVSRPIKALTVYPPNTPATLVPKVLPTKRQVKIHIFTLIQLFLEFGKTCKKRITPTGLTERERRFEQTKECYLKEVIPFFKTLKDNFEGIQKALTKKIKEMNEVFKELEAKVAQYAVDRKHDAIEQKNLFIANDNLIVECLSKEMFSVATNSELNVAQFTEITVAHTNVEARCLELKAGLLSYVTRVTMIIKKS